MQTLNTHPTWDFTNGDPKLTAYLGLAEEDVFYDAPEVPLKKDGTPDLRYKVNQRMAKPKVASTQVVAINPTGPLKKDGTPDMRFKANRKFKKAAAPAPQEVSDTPTGPLKKDGTPGFEGGLWSWCWAAASAEASAAKPEDYGRRFHDAPLRTETKPAAEAAEAPRPASPYQYARSK